MAVGNPPPKKGDKYAVDLAIAAVVGGNQNPLDMPMDGIDSSPTSLDLILPGKRGNRPAAAAVQAGGTDGL